MGQRTIFLVVSGPSTQTKSVITDFLGNAPLGGLSLSPGAYTVTAYFNGTIPLTPTPLTLTDDRYGNATATKPYTIQKLNQTITFVNPPAQKIFGDADFTVTATASSGLPVTLAATGSCSLVSGKVHITAVGNCAVTANQAGSALYNPATATLNIPIRWSFTGFLFPVNNPPKVNTVRAGVLIPFRFDLGGNRGLNILASGSPIVTKITCPNGAPTGEVPPDKHARQDRPLLRPADGSVRLRLEAADELRRLLLRVQPEARRRDGSQGDLPVPLRH
jgi:hypothetical protein